ncbi:MAG TPA: sulfurtransferase TusA family protein [bacterium]|nr:sulfurtransferase TusA family protein [bacterium]HOL47120.1 sulfurtransferase TusA family protein [bacterium]HPQ18874.1 sulfurtransferase TusA family protein [bacterium]
MMRLPKKILNEIYIYKEKLEKYLKGEITDSFFRGIRVPWGFYSQRGGKIVMSRLRIPAGLLTIEQLKAIGKAAIEYGDGKLHITTRQDIQIHNVKFENTIKIIEYLKDYNISPRGGGGNTVRNITACYLSGICPYENFEVNKIAIGLSEYLLNLDESLNLPRKFKISFSGCVKDCAYTGVNDCGIIALSKDKFKILCGGGMGAKSEVGKVLFEEVSLEEIGYIIKAIINLFFKYGDRKNRYRNRLRFLIENIGWGKFKKLFNEEYEKVKNEEYININVNINLPNLKNKKNGLEIEYETDEEYNKFKMYNTGEQKQKGKKYIQLRIPNGEIEGKEIIEIAEIAERIEENIIFRTSQRQNIIISNVPAEKLKIFYDEIKRKFKNYQYPETIYDIVVCKSVSTCNLGICNAIALAPEIEKKLKEIDIDIDKLKGIKININGCPNACGQHPIGTISFSGMARKVYNRSVPFYKVYYGGKIAGEKTKLAEEIGIIPARKVPEFVKDIIFEIQNNNQAIIKIIKNNLEKYLNVPTIEEDKSYYIDFGKEELFTLEGITAGECGAGVIDMIEADLLSAKQSLQKAYINNFDKEELKKSLIYSARALLVVKGIDPKNDDEIIENFINKFVLSGIVSSEFKNIKEKCLTLLNNEDSYKYAEKLYMEIKSVYESMDSNFNFLIKEEKKEEIKEGQKEEIIFDLRGTPCPINYVKIKLKLEELQIGDILEVYLDDGEPIKNVPASLQNDGHEIIAKEKKLNYYKIKIKKKF